MVYRRFRLSVVVQVVLIQLACIVAAYLIVATSYYATIALVTIVLGVQVATLLHYVQRTNRDLSRFLLTIEHSDFSQTFAAEPPTGAFGRLADAFERVLDRFRETRSAKEEQSAYLNTLVQHVPIAVIAVDGSGQIDILNNAARKLFSVAELRNLHDLKSFGREFAGDILRLEAGRQELMKVMRSNELFQLNVSATGLRMRGRDLKIVTLQDIRRELEAREVTAWQNLIRVLTHEIMNSVTPISSLAATAGELLTDAQVSGAAGPSAADAVRDAKDAVDTIAQRGAGLIHFVESYRRLTHLPKPTVSKFSAAELFSRIRQLMARDLEARSVTLKQSVDGEVAELSADPELIEQAIINLVRNAIDAMTDVVSPQITMSAHVDASGRPTIAIADNGHGMDETVRENIFVPFYTTKRDGTGVGLSVVQQIMRSHQGSVEVASAVGQGTEIRLVF
jgi:nitrogen fixation/metabolism regulation signal transduction histidine kinase